MSLALALACALMPGGSTIMPVWHAGEPAEVAPMQTGATDDPRRAERSPLPPAIVPKAEFSEPVGSRMDVRRLRLAGPFPAEVTAVVDGDTFEARVTIWLGHEVTTRVRLIGIDAAELGSDCREERAMALESRAVLAAILGRRVDLSDVRFDKYGGRVLARARSAAHGDVSAAMLAGGYAIVYEGGRRQAWCDPVVTSRR